MNRRRGSTRAPGPARSGRGWPSPSSLLWRVLDTVLDRGAPPGILLRGAVVGGLYALGRHRHRARVAGQRAP